MIDLRECRICGNYFKPVGHEACAEACAACLPSGTLVEQISGDPLDRGLVLKIMRPGRAPRFVVIGEGEIYETISPASMIDLIERRLIVALSPPPAESLTQ